MEPDTVVDMLVLAELLVHTVVDLLVLAELLVHTVVDLLVLAELLVQTVVALLLHVQFVAWFCNLFQDVHVDDMSCRLSFV